VFITLVNDEVREIVTGPECRGLVLDMFRTFVEPLESEFGIKSNHRVGRFSDAAKSQQYNDRIEAINFSLAHDDGQSARNLEQADVILVGVSRSGKTPTSLYLAMQYGLKAANYPLIPDDFDRKQLPPALTPFRRKIFGLTIQPERLSEIRNERRPNSRYASLDNCRMEVAEGEAMMRRAGIRWLSTTTKSIEEIATTFLQEVRPERLEY
jgi:regulator of PEP synthase PpsR (kinase-PPPase family)